MRTKTSDAESKQSAAKANVQAQRSSRSEHPLRQLQRRIGNRAVGSLIQAKLGVSQPGDASEQEADRIAKQVMGMSDSEPTVSPDGSPASVQTKCSECNEGGNTCAECAAAEQGTAQRQVIQMTGIPVIQRELDVCELGPEEEALPVPEEEANQSEAEPAESTTEEESIQRQESSLAEAQSPSEESPVQRSPDGHLYTSSDVSRSIESTKGDGSSLPGSVQEELGSKMGADFSGVRIHTDSNAVRLNRELSSHAFTHGRDIYFNEGKYDPQSSDGKFLLAHELAHTMQQNHDSVRRLAITVKTPLAKSACGGRFVQWIFGLDTAAPDDGYIVQKVEEYNREVKCPASGSCLAKPTFTFWEAWFVKKGATNEHLHSTMGFTDQSAFPGKSDVAGFRVHTGEVKFFTKVVTGDLGKDGVAPSSPNGGWGPGAVPITGDLPSTSSTPSWWGSTPTEGPKNRMAYSAWRCCSGSGDFNVVKATP